MFTARRADKPHIHRTSDKNRGCNSLAFPHGCDLIRENREGWTPARTMDLLRSERGGLGLGFISKSETVSPPCVCVSMEQMWQRRCGEEHHLICSPGGSMFFTNKLTFFEWEKLE